MLTVLIAVSRTTIQPPRYPQNVDGSSQHEDASQLPSTVLSPLYGSFRLEFPAVLPSSLVAELSLDLLRFRTTPPTSSKQPDDSSLRLALVPEQASHRSMLHILLLGTDRY